MSVHEAAARALFVSGCNCAQSVVGAFCDVTGLPLNTALCLASSFGAGMGRMRLTCGAVTGMFMVAGLLYGVDDQASRQERAEHYQRIRTLAEKFTAIHNTITCSELLQGLAKDKSPTPEERTPEYYQVRPCVRFVQTAARLLDEYIAQYPPYKSASNCP